MRLNRKHVYRTTVDDPAPPYVPVTRPPWIEDVLPIDVNSISNLPSKILDSLGRLVLEEVGLFFFHLLSNLKKVILWVRELIFCLSRSCGRCVLSLQRVRQM